MATASDRVRLKMIDFDHEETLRRKDRMILQTALKRSAVEFAKADIEWISDCGLKLNSKAVY